MPKPLISCKNGYYNSRGFTYTELLACLPREMLRAKAQLGNSLCRAYFHTNENKELICQVMRDTERGQVVGARYYWSILDENWCAY